MPRLYKINGLPKSVPLLCFEQALSYTLTLLLVLVSLNPVQAGMAMGRDMAAMDMSHAALESMINVNDGLQGQGRGATASPRPMMARTAQTDECESDCDCCPGLCSAYLPSHLYISSFLPLPFTWANSAILRKVSTSTSLFRPPIFT